ncbi:MAG: hypothetical protein QOD89_3175 [Bradyrhizobium sp.]|jgi:hypothetical protein|nr:hypothetical protein [Bradyrhizobium sp.]
MKRSAGLVCASLLAATVATAIPQGAKAESGFLWLESAYAVPASQTHYTPRWKRVNRPRAVGARAVSYVSAPPRPAVVRIAAVAPSRADCFWCNVRISGLSF